jgi:arylsulfatase
MERLTENCVLNLKNKSHSVTAEIELADGPASGVIIAQGGQFGGWSLYAKDGRLKYCYNFLGLQRYYAQSARPIPSGKHQLRMEFTYDGDGLGKGGNVKLLVDGEPVGEGRVGATQPMIYSTDETCDVGAENGSPVSDDYPVHANRFSGSVNWVQLDQGLDDHDHLISPEERLRVAMARQ